MAEVIARYYRIRFFGGTIILAIVMTMLLFVVGFAFMIDTQIALDTAGNDTIANALDTGLTSVTAKIQDVLAKDIDQYFQGELYDYPGEDDRWLAAIEPVIWGKDSEGKNIYSWPHITDLWEDWEPQYRPFPAAAIDPHDGILKLRAVAGQGVPYYDPVGRYDDTEINFDHWQRAGLTQYNYNNPHRFWVSAYNTVAKIVAVDDPIVDVVRDAVKGDLAPWQLDYAPYNVDLPIPSKPPLQLPSGHRADADGDGVADARWHRLEHSKDTNGEYIYAAVRIIDNSSMLNINTAGGKPPINSGQWDGTKLSDIDLASMALHTSDNPSELFNFRISGKRNAPPTHISTETYHHEVARRLLNPNMRCHLFGIVDEIELRYRFMLNSDIKTMSEMVWPYTIAPNGSGSKKRPFNRKKGLHTWYQKVADDYTDRNHAIYNQKPNLYTKRHIMTTLSKSRELRPTGNITDAVLRQLGMASTPGLRKFDLHLPAHLADGVEGRYEKEAMRLFIKQLAGAIYRGLPNDTIIGEKVSPNDRRITMAWQYAINIIDYQDYDGAATNGNDRPTLYYDAISDTTYVGVENEKSVIDNTLQISEISAITEKVTGDIFYALEIFNPSPYEKILSSNDEDGENGEASFMLEIKGATTDAFMLTGVIPGNGYIVLLGASKKKKAFEILAALKENGSDYLHRAANVVVNNKMAFNKDDQISIYKKSWVDGATIPVDTIVVPFSPDSDVLVAVERICYISGATRRDGFDTLRLYEQGDDQLPGFWTDAVGDSLGDPLPLLTPLLVDAKPVMVPMETVDQPLRTIGEIANIFAIGTRFGDPNLKPPCTFIASLSSTVSLSQAKRNEDGIPLHNYGRIDFSDQHFWSLFDYLTLIDPASDFDDSVPPVYDAIPVRIAIDNDGKSYTTNTPGADGLDNNFNFYIDELTEKYDPHLYEHCINGRININTAPWRVIQRLPWLSYGVNRHTGEAQQPPRSGKGLLRSGHLAMAMVAYRDKQALKQLEANAPSVWPLGTTPDYTDRYDIASLDVGAVKFEGRRSQFFGAPTAADTAHIRAKRGFISVAELLHVRSCNFAANGYIQSFDIRKYLDGYALLTPPSYDAKKGHSADDFLERDVLFQRISNLVTVRSDLFTAYILLRYGKKGPQHRHMVTFDRSNVFNGADIPQVVISHRVLD